MYKTSEHSLPHTGFLATYEGKMFMFSIIVILIHDLFYDLNMKHINNDSLNVLIAVCGGELDMESGQLESPNYPEDYQPNKECIWRVSVSVGFQVALKFQSFEVRN